MVGLRVPGVFILPRIVPSHCEDPKEANQYMIRSNKIYKGFEGSSAELRVRLVILGPVSKFHGMIHQHEASPFRRNMFGTSTFSKSEMTCCPLGWFILTT